MKKLLIIPMSVAVAACATPATETGPAATAQSTETVQSAQPAQAPEPSPGIQSAQAGEQQADDSEAMVADNRSAENAAAIEALQAPQVDEVQPGNIPGRGVPESTVVCEKVYPTGSVLPTKVCRDRTNIDRKQEADQRIFDDIKRNTAIGNTRL
ncbi:MAG: hypothetical protein ACR2QS_12485 [Woeseiaceae bacterium]